MSQRNVTDEMTQFDSSLATMSDNGLANADINGNNKRKREDEENVGPDSQRLATPHGNTNGSIPGLTNDADSQGFNHAALGHYDATSSDLNIDEQLLTHVAQSNGMPDDNTLTANAKAALAANPQHKYPGGPDTGFDGQISHGLPFTDHQLTHSTGGLTSHGPHESTAAAVYAAREAQSMTTKPTVGSPEWHALRKNNHKEGMHIHNKCSISVNFFFLTTCQSSAVVAKPSTKVSTISPSWCPIVIRTRAPSCSVQ